MRQRMIIAAAAAVYIAATLLSPSKAHALEAWIEKAKSDCKSMEAGITLTFSHDDTGDSEIRDYFKLEIYDATKGQLIAHIEESILQEQSPFYWQTGRIEGATFQGDYRIEVWDTDDKGKKQRRIDQAFLQCSTQNTWRSKPTGETPDTSGFPPPITCYSRTPLYSTNTAPEAGAVIIQWTFGKTRTDPEWHLQTIPVVRGDSFDMQEIEVPCGTYLRIYYQPDSTKILYYMPSQYWPHDLYGTATKDFSVGPVYHTFFPLDGPLRGEDKFTPTPTPTATPTLTPTP